MLGQQVVVQNQGGAAAQSQRIRCEIGAGRIHAPYHSTTGIVHAVTDKLPYDWMRDLAPVSTSRALRQS
jgi:hypothetical protein